MGKSKNIQQGRAKENIKSEIRGENDERKYKE